MKKMKVEDSIGCVIPHDMTKIVKDEFKGPLFKKGHIIKEEDIDKLLSIGKEHIYVWEDKENIVHEDDAAKVLGSLFKNDYMELSDIKEGKIEVLATKDAFFEVDRDLLESLNMNDDMMIATRMGNLRIHKGDKLAAMRIIPLLIDQEKLNNIVELAKDKELLKLTPLKKLNVGIITTGSEVFKGRIKDTFTPVIKDKLVQFNIDNILHTTVTDNKELIKNAILDFKDKGMDLIICTGGMSVDPDDLTPGAIKISGANIVSYGSPVLPGAMFLLGYFDNDAAVVGVPGCAMYHDITVFDIILPYILAGRKVDKTDLAKLGYGGLCLNCEVCHYPNCQLGKGV